jgi:ATP-dependent exoDNAse (exonuclease V) beta subunit
MGRVSGRSDRSVLSWFDIPGEQGRERKIISPVGPRAEIENDPLHRFIEQTEKRKDRHEQVRLLYVACTRAQKALHLVGHVATARDGTSYKPPARGTLLHLLWDAVEPEFARAFSDYKVGGAPDAEDIWVDPVLRRLRNPWELPDTEPLPLQAEHASLADAGDEVEFYWVGSEARIAGTLVHRWLHQIAAGRAAADPAALPGYRPVTRRWLRELGISGDDAADIAQRVELALNGMLTDDKGQWILEGRGHAELALTGVVDGQAEGVVLDRVKIDEDGNHWIIDYKTSSHEGGNLDGFLATESERYGPQLRKYASIYNAFSGCDARCALYFPLLQRFVEL